MKDTFIFYRSFLDAIRTLQETDQLKIFNAIADYALDQKEPELEGTVKGFWMLMKPIIEANNKRYENGKKGAEHGKKGGRPKKDKGEEKPQENPNETPKDLSLTPNKDKDKDVYVKNKFEEFRKNFPGTKRGFQIEYDNFINKNSPEIVDLLLPALNKEITHKKQLSDEGKFCPEWKNLQTWINKKSWTEEYPPLKSGSGNGNGIVYRPAPDPNPPSDAGTVMCIDGKRRKEGDIVIINGEKKKVNWNGSFGPIW